MLVDGNTVKVALFEFGTACDNCVGRLVVEHNQTNSKAPKPPDGAVTEVRLTKALAQDLPIVPALVTFAQTMLLPTVNATTLIQPLRLTLMV